MSDENTQNFSGRRNTKFTNLQGNVWQQEGRINNQILRVKGLKYLKLLI